MPNVYIYSLELKREYFLHQGDTSSTGGLLQYEIKLDEIADKVIKLADYKTKLKRDLSPSGNWHGIGCSFFYHGCGFTGAGERDIIKPKVRLKKYSDNRVQIFVSSTEIGQGSLTTLSKIVANILEIPLTRVIHEYPDTDSCPDSGPTVASRTIMIVGKLLSDCAFEMKSRWNESEFEIERQFVYPGNRYWDKINNEGNAYLEYSWGANVVEVEIDPITYVINIIGIWAVYDIGTPIDGFEKAGSVQCGYCTPGMIMAAEALLRNNPHPTEADVRIGLSGNLCRCTGYNTIVEAVLTAAREGERLW